MRAFAIVIKDHPVSEAGWSSLNNSSLAVDNDFEIEKFDAVIPDTAKNIMSEYKLKWNYPWQGNVLDPWTGLRKSAYGEKDPMRRVSCSLSHFLLWKKCADSNEPLLILEHDSVFTYELAHSIILDSKFGVIGINDPVNSTFAASTYSSLIKTNSDEIQPVPMLTSKEIPQGLAGNSAYILKPFAAKHLIELCYKYGLWPNDAIMCQQLCPWLGITRTYYTKSQNLSSTTSN